MHFWGRWIHWDSDCIGLMMELSSNDNSELSKNNPTKPGNKTYCSCFTVSSTQPINRKYCAKTMPVGC